MNLNGIAGATTAATALSNLILVTPNTVVGYQPQTGSALLGQAENETPPTLLFNYEGTQKVKLESDITDHYVEDNTAIQDQIALKPEMIYTQGFIGELNDVAPVGLQTLKLAADKLTAISAYTPAISTTALIAYTEALFAYQVAANAANAGVSAWSSLSGGNSGEAVLNETSEIDISSLQSKQQIYFQQFYGYWKNRVLFTVQTPWGVFSNCAIASVDSEQEAETNVVTSFTVTFKVIRFASTYTTLGATQDEDFQGRAADQSSGLVDNGVQTPQTGASLREQLLSNFPGGGA